MTEPMPVGLVRVDPAAPGLTRRRRGRGWSFLKEAGEPITDPDRIARSKALVIPLGWREVLAKSRIRIVTVEPGPIRTEPTVTVEPLTA